MLIQLTKKTANPVDKETANPVVKETANPVEKKTANLVVKETVNPVDKETANPVIPSDESKVHIEVLSVLWGNRLPIPDGSLPLSRYKGLKTKQKRADGSHYLLKHPSTRLGVRFLQEGKIPSTTSAADVAATWASGTQSTDVALPRMLTWDPHVDMAMGLHATWHHSGGDTCRAND
ncbi:hypothetical protein Tco_0437840 [Tanacetum coccineum]